MIAVAVAVAGAGGEGAGSGIGAATARGAGGGRGGHFFFTGVDLWATLEHVPLCLHHCYPRCCRFRHHCML